MLQLLLGNASFPLCVALAILQQLRSRLLEAEFNDCILLFSDLPAIDIEQCVNDSIRVFCATPKSLTYRKHAFDNGKDPLDEKVTTSPDLTLEDITLEMQRSDKVPRISGEELLALLGLKAMNDNSDRHFRQTKAVAVDVRPNSEYKKSALPNCPNMPLEGAFGEDGELLVNHEALQIGKQKKSKVICLIGSMHTMDAKIFAEKLLRLNFHRVCFLHKGIEIFKHNILIVPNT